MTPDIQAPKAQNPPVVIHPKVVTSRMSQIELPLASAFPCRINLSSTSACRFAAQHVDKKKENKQPFEAKRDHDHDMT